LSLSILILHLLHTCEAAEPVISNCSPIMFTSFSGMLAIALHARVSCQEKNAFQVIPQRLRQPFQTLEENVAEATGSSNFTRGRSRNKSPCRRLFAMQCSRKWPAQNSLSNIEPRRYRGSFLNISFTA
jgi:hypothetical protein